MRRNWINGLVAACLAGTVSGRDGETYHNDPTDRYERCQVEGFSVLVNPRMHEHPSEGARAMDELNRQLRNVVRVVPPGILERFRRVPIWVEWQETPGLGEFHPDGTELTRERRNLAKVGAVEIVNARHLVEWAHAQPWAVLHELAHAYHFLVLGKDDPAVTQAYEAAMASRRYDRVAYILGGQKEAFARKNRYEYFAELSEAYFGKNDFEPADRRALARFDPGGYQLMARVWGEPAGDPGP